MFRSKFNNKSNKYMKMLLVVLVLSFFQFAAQAQPQRARERVQTLKKVKLVEILNLNEAEADKFLAKYSGYENRINEKRQAMQNAMSELNQSLKGDKSGLKAKSENILKLQEEMQNLQLEKIRGMRSSLNEEQFAKYLLFERSFARELKMRMDGMGPNGKGKGRGPGHREDD